MFFLFSLVESLNAQHFTLFLLSNKARHGSIRGLGSTVNTTAGIGKLIAQDSKGNKIFKVPTEITFIFSQLTSCLTFHSSSIL